MPYLNAKISGAESSETTAKVAEALTGLTAEILGKKPEVTSVAVEFVPGDQWVVGGAPIAAQGVRTFYLEIKITAGTNTKDQKAAYLKEVFSSMETILGELHPASYIVIQDVGADSWGFEGVSQEYRYIEGRML